MRLIGLLVTFLPALALADYLDLTVVPPWVNTNGTPVNLTGAHYEWRKGCSAPGLYELGTSNSPGPAIRIDALPNTGRCYVRVEVVQANGVSSVPSDEGIFDMDRGLQIPSTPTTGPTVTWSVAPPVTSWTKSFNFRALAAYVTDAPGSTYVIGERYPTTRNGVTFGWEHAVETRNRSTTVPALAGVAQLPSTWGLANTEFRIDVPPGRYNVRVAAGDVIGNAAFYEIRDGSTVLFTQTQAIVPADQFKDASGANRSAAQWAVTNVPRELLIITGVFRFVLKRPTTASSVIAHLSLERLP